MLIGDTLYVNNTLELLKGFIFDSYRVYRRKGILSGSGLKKEDFSKPEKNSKATTKMFSKRINEFLESKWVKRLEHKSNKNKYYAITPIGITYFCANYKKIDSRTIDHVMSHLKYFYEQGKPSEEISYIEQLKSSWFELSEIFPESQLVALFTNLFKNIEQEKTLTKENEPKLEITLKYKTIEDLTIPVIMYDIVNEEYRLQMDKTIDDMWTDYYYESNETKFNYNFAKFILKAFAFSILEDSSYKLMIANTGRKNILMSTINKIPLEIHGMALEFSEELYESRNKTSGSIDATSRNIEQLLRSRKIETIHEIKEKEDSDRLIHQYYVYTELVAKIDKEKIPVYTKAKLKELMLKTNAWENKKELEKFWRKNLRDLRKGFLEEGGTIKMYKRIFAREIKEIERSNKETAKEYEKLDSVIGYNKILRSFSS